mmetsp:Transcript_100220/g.214694  ORF Transcript_100220/g.214694 Transcript_100220/m.214694 type:complete len:140 (-) Transcript_100220:44-463(-)
MTSLQRLALLTLLLLCGSASTTPEPSCTDEVDSNSLIQNRRSTSSSQSLLVNETEFMSYEAPEEGSNANKESTDGHCTLTLFKRADNFECVDYYHSTSPTTVYYCKEGKLIYCGEEAHSTCVDFQQPDPCGTTTEHMSV